MVSYQAIKHVHMFCAILSIALFLLRGVLSLLSVRWRQWKFLRWLPHSIDTILLLSAIVLAIWIQQYPFVHHWLTAKVLALIVYIILGSMALKAGIPKFKRAFLLLVSLLVFVYIIGIARTHSATSWITQWL